MYQPSTDWFENEGRLEAASWIKTLVPGGARGVALKSNWPFMAVWAESLGFVREERSRLIARTGTNTVTRRINTTPHPSTYSHVP